MINQKNELIFMTREEAKLKIRSNKTAILPIGSIEQHGPHLPHGTDILLAKRISEEVAKKTGFILLPPVYIGYSWVWEGIPGSLSISRNHLEDHLIEIAKGAQTAGFRKIIIINGHDSNNATIKYWSRNLQKILPDFETKYFMYPGITKIYNEKLESKMWVNMYHAGELETSLMMYLFPDLVKKNKFVKEYPKIDKNYGNSTLKLSNISKTGVFGDATVATKEKGENLFKTFVKNIIKVL